MSFAMGRVESIARIAQSLACAKMCCPRGRDGARLSATMDSPRSVPAARASTLAADILQAARQIDGASLAAMLAIFVGWFLADTLAVSLGSLQHGVRFFDISSAIADPSRIFFAADAPVQRGSFALLCLLCLASPIFPHCRKSRLAWAAYLAPLALMLICGALLYSKTSGELFSAPAAARSLSSSVIRFANDVVHRGGGLVASHVSIGMGGYLAFAGSLALAAQGMRRFLSHAS
jgi:hypothetical protein